MSIEKRRVSSKGTLIELNTVRKWRSPSFCSFCCRPWCALCLWSRPRPTPRCPGTWAGRCRGQPGQTAKTRAADLGPVQFAPRPSRRRRRPRAWRRWNRRSLAEDVPWLVLIFLFFRPFPYTTVQALIHVLRYSAKTKIGEVVDFSGKSKKLLIILYLFARLDVLVVGGFANHARTEQRHLDFCSFHKFLLQNRKCVPNRKSSLQLCKKVDYVINSNFYKCGQPSLHYSEQNMGRPSAQVAFEGCKMKATAAPHFGLFGLQGDGGQQRKAASDRLQKGAHFKEVTLGKVKFFVLWDAENSNPLWNELSFRPEYCVSTFGAVVLCMEKLLNKVQMAKKD